MLYAISVDLGDPTGDNDVLLQALENVNASPLRRLLRGREWLAACDVEPQELKRFLLKHSRDGDHIEIKALRKLTAGESRARYDKAS